MTYPESWDEAEAKLKTLYPDDFERGIVFRALLDRDEPKALKYFKDNDAAVKATLDALTITGMSNYAE